MKTIFGKTFDVIQKALELRSRRNALLASNIANVDTPGFREKDLDFNGLMEGYMKELEVRAKAGTRAVDEKKAFMPLEQDGSMDPAPVVTDPRHMTGLPGEAPRGIVISRERGVPNNVDLDGQMSKLSENNLQYQAAIQMLMKKFELLREAVTEGGRQ